MAALTALIVEDDEELGIIFSHALKAAQFETEVVQRGELVLKRMEALRPNLLILDLHLPGATGIQVMRAIQEDGRFKETRIIVASADPRMASLLDDEVDLVLLKPVSFRQLRDLGERFYASMIPEDDSDSQHDDLPHEAEAHPEPS